MLPCNGFIELGDIKFHCWLKGGHGGLNVLGAITGSCDCFFYEAARRTGVDRIAEMAGRLGFGKLSELGLPGKSPGIQPSRQWKQEKYSKPWQQGDTFNLGIGQGYMTATPLQLAIMAARVANGGYEVQPNLLLAKALPREELAPPQVRDQAQRAQPAPRSASIWRSSTRACRMWSTLAPAPPTQLRFDPTTNKPLEPALQFAGKTGTAQVKRITERERDMGITQDQLPWHLRHHASFRLLRAGRESALRLRGDRRARPGRLQRRQGRQAKCWSRPCGAIRRGTWSATRSGVVDDVRSRSERLRRRHSPNASGASTGASCWC